MGDETRREWVVTISRAVSLAVSGELYSIVAAPATTLPPGVYQPSTDHLGHALMSAERYHPIPAGSQTDYVRPRVGAYRPLFFSQAEFPVVLRLVQLMLGDVGPGEDVIQEVAEYFDLIVSKAESVRDAQSHLDPLHRALADAYYGTPERERSGSFHPEAICKDGLQWIFSVGHVSDPRSFLSLSAEDQIALLHSISDEPDRTRNENAGTRFFALLKTQTIHGFYTSREGLHELDYKGNAFYARSPGCDAR